MNEQENADNKFWNEAEHGLDPHSGLPMPIAAMALSPEYSSSQLHSQDPRGSSGATSPRGLKKHLSSQFSILPLTSCISAAAHL